MSAAAENADTPDLEALFDSIANARPAAVDKPVGKIEAAAAPEASAANEPTLDRASDKVVQQIGQMTRTLHDALRELGYDKVLQNAAETMPDARDRLAYIAAKTEEAAGRVLNATDAAMPIQDQLSGDAAKLSANWELLLSNKLGVDDFKSLVRDTGSYLKSVPLRTADTNKHLHEIMMAQDFQDLTGQVIKKITELAQDMEAKLISVLLEVAPRERLDTNAGLLNGPAINGHLRNDVVTSQNQVDELLESLGF
jgi:chemotaxis protein CheZ